jgi:hypothetical protein
MVWIRAAPEDQAQGALRDLDEKAHAIEGYVPYHVRAPGLRPAAIDAWPHPIGAIRSPMDPRRQELVGIAATRALRRSY